MTDLTLYAIKIPFANDMVYLTQDDGINISYKFFDSYEEAEEIARICNGKVVTVTFEVGL